MPHIAANLAIDPALLERAVEVSGERKNKAAVTRVRQELIARRQQPRMLIKITYCHHPLRFLRVAASSNMALNVTPFGRWRLRDKAAQRRLVQRWASP